MVECGPELASVLDGPGYGHPLAPWTSDQVAVVVLDGGDHDPLEVEVLPDAELDSGADALVDTSAD